MPASETSYKQYTIEYIIELLLFGRIFGLNIVLLVENLLSSTYYFLSVMSRMVRDVHVRCWRIQWGDIRTVLIHLLNIDTTRS